MSHIVNFLSLVEMESNVSKCKKGDFRIIVHKMEVGRILNLICCRNNLPVVLYLCH